MEGYHFQLKVAIVGAGGVGKSSLLKAEDDVDPDFNASGEWKSQTAQDEQVERKKMIPGPKNSGSPSIHFKTKDYFLNSYIYRVQYWDCPGSDRYLNLTSKYCSGSSAILLVFDLTSQKSFDQVSAWLERFDENKSTTTKILVGNKSKCASAPRQVPRSLAQGFAVRHGMAYYETDALSNTGCSEVFRELFLQVVNSIPQPPDPKDLLNKGIKVGPKLLNDKKYRDSLQAAASNNAEDASFCMDWL
mmetsp:Transcript_1831/g.3075  ORF Transcript_1831/g.3075 Transcript_1831/m.3075 type:complete len:246 (+) Transcript_1831:1559-2296(+)